MKFSLESNLVGYRFFVFHACEIFFCKFGISDFLQILGALKKFYTWSLRPSSNPLPFYVSNSFVDRKGTSLVYLPLTNSCPFTDLQSGTKVVDPLV